MALEFPLVLDEAKAAQALCNTVVTITYQIQRFLAHNSNLAIDWGAATTPSYITEDASGNIQGLNFSRGQVSNVLFSLQQITNVVNNQAATQGDHLGNMNQLAGPFG